MKRTVLHRFISLFSAFLMLAAFLLAIAVRVQATSIAIHSVDTYEEYRDLVREENPAYGFVDYRHIRVLGEFQKYSFGPFFGQIRFGNQSLLDFHGDVKAYIEHAIFQYDWAAYSLTDKNDFAISLEITGKLSYFYIDYYYYKNTPLTQPEGMTDMRLLGREETGFLQRGPLLYHYNEGKLNCIIFELGNTFFKIDGDLDVYPMDGEKTIVSQMLSIDEKVAERAYRKLIADIPAQSGYYTPLIVDGIVILCVIAGVCAAAVIITKRIRKRRNAKTVRETQQETNI